jgi:hypothetical protein
MRSAIACACLALALAAPLLAADEVRLPRIEAVANFNAASVVVPGINDDFRGKAPDIGPEEVR